MQLTKKNIQAIFLGVMGCIVLYWVLNEGERVRAVVNFVLDVAQPFLVGACLAFILNVPMRAFEKMLKKISSPKARRAVAILLTLISFAVAVAGVVYLLIPQIQETITTLMRQLPPFFLRVEGLIREFLEKNPQVFQWIRDNTELETVNWMSVMEETLNLAGNGLSQILGGTITAVGSVVSGAMDVVFSLAFALYSLASKETLARQCRKLCYAFMKESSADQVVRIFRLTNSTFSNYISGQCIEVVILGSLIALGMMLFKMPYIPLISVLGAVTALVPLVGAFVGCIASAFFILVNDPMQAVWFVVMFLVIQQIEGNVIYPRVVGTSIGLPSMWVLLAVAVGGDTMGVAGMVLMIPLASVIYTLLREYTANRLDSREIPPEKLQAQPPELVSKFREKRDEARKKRQARQAQRLAEMMKRTLHLPENHHDEL